MKQIGYIVFAIVGFFLLHLVIFKFAGPIPLSITSTVTQKSDTFNVTGEGTVDVPPDIAVVSVGVQVDGATVKAAQSGLNTKINAVSDAVKRVGVAGGDIKTTNYSIYPQYDYSAGTKPRISGYSASSNLMVKVRDIDKTNDAIDAATANGANQIGGISFDVDDRDRATDDARGKAVTDAKAKAQAAATAAGFRLGRIINYSEGTSGGVQPPMLLRADAALEKGGGTQIEPGSNEIKITVTLSYEIL